MAKPIGSFERYGLQWPSDILEIDLELFMIRQGLGDPFVHYKQLQSLLWPERDHHRWSDLILRELLNNRVTCIQGSKDSGKTSCTTAYALTDYLAFSDCTLIMISSTETRGGKYRIWAEIVDLFQRAKAVYPEFPGIVLENRTAITDEIKEGEGRDPRRGVIFIPSLGPGGLSRWIGIKQKRRRLIADEAPHMKDGFLQAMANLLSGDFKAVLMGNPIANGDPMDQAAEPKNGWDSIPEPTKTTVWENRWEGGRTIQLVGTDSPNFDYDGDKPRYPYLIHRQSIEEVCKFYGRDSATFISQCLGIRKAGVDAHKVLTRQLCLEHHAMEAVTWGGGEQVNVVGLDAAYGGVGGDRCVLQHVMFGKDMMANQIILFTQPVIVPVTIKRDMTPEDQIATFCRDWCDSHDVPPENFFYDSTGRGSLGIALARAWSDRVNPVEFGGSATARVVSADLWIIDAKTGKRRQKLCHEQFSKFVSELWFMLRYAIEGDQVRGLCQELIADACIREWGFATRGRQEVEPKVKTKERMGRSPDLADAAVTALEGARRRGFMLAKVGKDTASRSMKWLEEARKSAGKLATQGQLNYAA